MVAWKWQWTEPSHDICRDFDCLLKDLRAWNLFLLLLICWNLVFGPNKDEERYNQIRAALKHLFEHSSPAQCPLFQELAGRMVEELEHHDVHHFDHAGDLEGELWEFLKSRAAFAKVGRALSIAKSSQTKS